MCNVVLLEQEIEEEAIKLGKLLLGKKIFVSTAESCTGGLISASITEIPNSSNWFDRSFITYTNKAKMEMLGVKKETLDSVGAVSLETVQEMALGALKFSDALYSVSVSGIAGPTGGRKDKPLGFVCFGLAYNGKIYKTFSKVFKGDRKAVRLQTTKVALAELNLLIKDTLKD